ncbi:hypothetical protein M405DRAFT_205661 [Rhizopogon salebrosus TDB-379]|nr:hypothetical protein M405DRAFT_205661 [Rhizopogon salebrosus TDB-379]
MCAFEIGSLCLSYISATTVSKLMVDSSLSSHGVRTELVLSNLLQSQSDLPIAKYRSDIKISYHLAHIMRLSLLHIIIAFTAALSVNASACRFDGESCSDNSPCCIEYVCSTRGMSKGKCVPWTDL